MKILVEPYLQYILDEIDECEFLICKCPLWGYMSQSLAFKMNGSFKL